MDETPVQGQEPQQEQAAEHEEEWNEEDEGELLEEGDQEQEGLELEEDVEGDEEQAFGDFAIVAFGLESDESEALIYSTIDWGYETEEEAWEILEEMAQAGELEPGDYAVIQLCTGHEPISVD